MSESDLGTSKLQLQASCMTIATKTSTYYEVNKIESNKINDKFYLVVKNDISK